MRRDEIVVGEVYEPAHGVRTDFWRKPIPTNWFDWSAWIDGEEELGSGFGPTEEAAINDLSEMLESRFAE